MRAEAPAREKPHERRVDSLVALADEAYVYGYPLLILDATFRDGTNVAAPQGHRAPVNQFARVDVLPDASFTAVVLPNVDTLYTSAFLDLTAEPIVLHVPEMQDRYYLMPMLDAYTNVFASPGTRTTGGGALNVAIVGPNFQGALPEGLTKVEAPTNLVWLLGRTQINGKQDLPSVVALTNAYTLTPLSSVGKPYTAPQNTPIDPALDMKTAPPKQVAAWMDHTYFERLSALLQKYPPPAADKEALARFEALGLSPGKFSPSPAAAQAIQGAGARVVAKLNRYFNEMTPPRNGWTVHTTLGSYGTHFLERATVALRGLGANLAEDAIYPFTTKDGSGEGLDGKNRYKLSFPKGQEPPANAFWSLTVYNGEGYLVNNPIQRYAIGSRDALQLTPDGTLELLIQSDKPVGELAANWLPTAPGPLLLVLRIYWPKESVFTGAWVPPSVQRVRFAAPSQA